MRRITFKWSDTIFEGTIISQGYSQIQGQKTVIETDTPTQQEFTIYGKCQEGECGPFTVLSIIEHSDPIRPFNSQGLRYVNPEVGEVDVDEEYY